MALDRRKMLQRNTRAHFSSSRLARVTSYIVESTWIRRGMDVRQIGCNSFRDAADSESCNGEFCRGGMKLIRSMSFTLALSRTP